MDQNIAVYIAGDSGIFFPGLVALCSVRQHNAANHLDYYMCFDGADLTVEMDALLRKYDITFVDTAELAAYGSVEGLGVMKEDRWPVHVFYNWVFPYWLRDRGYLSALKADYDMLCVGEYNLSELMPRDATVSALTFEVDLIREGVTPQALDELGIPQSGGQARIPYYNAGVVGMNLEQYVTAGTFAMFRYAYLTIQDEGASVANAEQAALAIVAYHDQRGLEPIPAEYNQRITIFPELDEVGMPRLKNIHYLTQNKPWRAPDYRYLSGYTKMGRTSVYIYRDIWHQYAKLIDGYVDFVDAHSPTPQDQIAMYTKVLGAYHA